MRRVIFSLLLLTGLIIVLLLYGYQPLISFLNLRPKGGILVEADKTAQVFIDDKEAGVTPFKDTSLREGEYQVKLIVASPSASWQGEVRINGGTLTVVNREFGDQLSKASGEVITLEKGSGVVVTSNPSSARVQLDGEDKGLTPLYIASLAPGNHRFLLSKNNFLDRSVGIAVTEGFKLNLAVDLAAEEVEPPSPLPLISRVVVRQTPTGFLRVRKVPSAIGEEISRVSPGDTLELIEETNAAWFKVKLPNGQEGYVSTAYVRKQVQAPR